MRARVCGDVGRFWLNRGISSHSCVRHQRSSLPTLSLVLEMIQTDDMRHAAAAAYQEPAEL